MRRGLIAGGLVGALAACTGGDDATGANDSIVLPERPPADSAATLPAAAIVTSSVAVGASQSADASTPLVTPIELDPCLVGSWTASVDTIGQLIAAAVLPVTDLSLVDGGFSVILSADGGAVGDAEFTAAFSIGDAPAQADVAWSGSGTWSTFDGVVTLSLDQQTGGLTEVRLDGAVQAGSQLDVELPLSGGTYGCTDTRLEVSARAGATSVPLVLDR